MGEIESYLLLITSTVMFGSQFFFSDMFRRNYGDSFKATLVSRLGGGIFGLIALVIINGFEFEFTAFAFVMALITNINSLFLSFCGLKALGKINLSLYSMFMMLGGMVLPFVAGILLYGEALTPAKAICFIIVAVALLVAVEKGKSKSGAIYYIGIFIGNGMSGVIAGIYNNVNAFEKPSTLAYSVLVAIIAIVATLILMLIFGFEKKKLNVKTVISMAGSGIFNRIANYFLLLALTVLPSSTQYPFITGGTIIVSTVFSFFTDKKPSKKELIAVVLAFIGILMLVVINNESVLFKLDPLIGG